MLHPIPEFKVTFTERRTEAVENRLVEWTNETYCTFKLDVLGGKSGKPNAGIITESEKNEGYLLKGLNPEIQRRLAQKTEALIRKVYQMPLFPLSIYIDKQDGHFAKFDCTAEVQKGRVVRLMSPAEDVPFEVVEKAKDDALRAGLRGDPRPEKPPNNPSNKKSQNQ